MKVQLPLLITCERGLGKMRPEICGRRWAIAHGKVDVGHGSPIGVAIRDSPCRTCTFGEARMTAGSTDALGEDKKKGKRGRPKKALSTPMMIPKQKGKTTIVVAPTAMLFEPVVPASPPRKLSEAKAGALPAGHRRCERKGCKGSFPRFKNRRFCPNGCPAAEKKGKGKGQSTAAAA